MGPQFFHCGNLPWPRSHRYEAQSFNGAAVLSLRKWVPVVWTLPGGALLQWGRSSFTAEISQTINRAPNADVLQWGRSSFTAEIIPTATEWDEAGKASMGPQFFHCGNGEARRGLV